MAKLPKLRFYGFSDFTDFRRWDVANLGNHKIRILGKIGIFAIWQILPIFLRNQNEENEFRLTNTDREPRGKRSHRGRGPPEDKGDTKDQTVANTNPRLPEGGNSQYIEDGDLPRDWLCRFRDFPWA